MEGNQYGYGSSNTLPTRKNAHRWTQKKQPCPLVFRSTSPNLSHHHTPSPSTPVAYTISNLPIWARRERLMKRQTTICTQSSQEDIVSLTEKVERIETNISKHVRYAKHESSSNSSLNLSYEGGATPTQPITDSPTYPIFEKPKISITERLKFPSPNLLHPPNVLEAGLLYGEAPPHRKDTVEKIPIRARSQSWLIRTRHLLDDEKLNRRTPIISKCMCILSILLVILTFPFCIPFCVRIAKEYERAVVFRLGRLIQRGTKGPGIFFIIPCIDTYKLVDLRVLSFDVPPQEILSRDSVTVSVEAVIYFRISNPVISVTNVNDAQFSTKLLAQTTLRNVLGTKTLSEILMERDNISNITEKVLDDGTDPWGVKVQRVEIKDIRLPHQLMRSMAAEAEAARDARARIIAADGERNASRSLVQAADTIRENKLSLHLRYLQTLAHVASEHNHTIVIPLPIEVIRGVMKKFKLWTKAS